VHRYKIYNGAMPTTSNRTGVTTGTAIKTMLQLATPSTRQLQIISWGFSMDRAPATTGSGVVELIQTDVAATVTASVAADVHPLDPNAPASLLTLGTTSTGYTSTSEGTPTATRLFDATHVTGVSNGASPTSYGYQFMPDERPVVAVSRFLRVRANFTAAVNLIAWVCWDE
jgi:hypothetical protein